MACTSLCAGMPAKKCLKGPKERKEICIFTDVTVRVLENKPARAMRSSPYKISVCELLLRHDVLSVEWMNVGSNKGRLR
jgi:hypothetical protein